MIHVYKYLYLNHFVRYLQTFRYQRFSYFAFTEQCSKPNFVRVQNNELVLSKILIKTGAS